MKTVHQSVQLFIWAFYTAAAIRLLCVWMHVRDWTESISLCQCRRVAVSVYILLYVCRHVYINRCSSSVFPPSILLLVLTTTGNRLRRQASAGAGREEAGKLMIPHQRSDKRRDIFPPQKHQEKTPAATCVRLSPHSLPPPCVLNALLPSPRKWAFILLLEKGKIRRELSTPLVLKNRNNRRAAGRHSVYREHKHYAGLITITVSTERFYLENKTLREDARSNSDGPFWCSLPRSYVSETNFYSLCTSDYNFHITAVIKERQHIKHKLQ